MADKRFVCRTDNSVAYVSVTCGYMTLKVLKYFCVNHGDQRFFQFEIILNVLVRIFRFI